MPSGWRREYATASARSAGLGGGEQGATESARSVLDMAFKENDSRIRKGDGAENVAIIRRFCLNLARLDGKKSSMRGKLKQAGWSDTRRAELLFGADA